MSMTEAQTEWTTRLDLPVPRSCFQVYVLCVSRLFFGKDIRESVTPLWRRYPSNLIQSVLSIPHCVYLSISQRKRGAHSHITALPMKLSVLVMTNDNGHKLKLHLLIYHSRERIDRRERREKSQRREKIKKTE